MNSEKPKSNNTVYVSEEVKNLIEIRERIKERLDIRTSTYLRKSNKYFLDYNKDWSLVWFINKFIMPLKWNENKVDNVRLVEIFEETQEDLFIDLLEYRIISKKINEFNANEEIVVNIAPIKSNLLIETSGKEEVAYDETEEVYL